MKNATDPIDVHKVMEEFDADREFIEEFLGRFLADVRVRAGIIHSAIERGDAETVRRQAHTIHGGAANIRARDLAQAAFELEALGKTGRLDKGLAVLQRLKRELTRLEEFGRTGL